MNTHIPTRQPWWEVALLWAGVAVSISEIWAGSLLAPAGMFWGLIIILAGHAAGGLFLSTAGLIGTRERKLSMQCIKTVTGKKGAIFPALLNLLQLAGWAAIMLSLSGETGAQIGSSIGGIFAHREFWILLIGAGTVLWAFLVDSKYHKVIHIVVISGILILTILLTRVSLNPEHYGGLDLAPRSIRSADFMRMFDLVIAMPISWVPLIADYASQARSGKKAFHASFWGYGIVSSWMYMIGLTVSLSTGSTDPAGNILLLMGRIGLAVPAMLLIFSSTMTSNFPDIYSSACSLLSIHPKIRKNYTMILTGILTIILALFVDMSEFESFLLAIGAFFVPLFTVLLLEFLVFRWGKKEHPSEGEKRSFYLPGIVSWLAGTGAFFLATGLNFPWGGSLTAFLVSGFLYSAWRILQGFRVA